MRRRASFDDMDCEEITIVDKNNKKVYTGRLVSAIGWAWRELLLSAIVKYPDTDQTSSMVDDIEVAKFLSDVEQYLRDEGGMSFQFSRFSMN